MDVLSQALSPVRLTGAIFAVAICTAPWGFAVAASQSAKSSEHLRPPNAPTISETQAMPKPKSIML
jgi:hypothetical protein